MSVAIGKVSLRGLIQENFQYGFLGAAGLTSADEGKAVTLDTGAANTVKLAGDGDMIIGRLEKVEVRSVEGTINCTVAVEGGMRFTVNPDATASTPDETPDIGDFLVGGTNSSSAKGYVQKAQSSEISAGKARWVVVETETIDSKAYVVAISI